MEDHEDIWAEGDKKSVGFEHCRGVPVRGAGRGRANEGGIG